MNNAHRKLGLLCFVVVVGCAGCAGFAGNDPTGGKTGESVATVSFPTGWGADSVDPATALQTHRQSLAGRPRQSRVAITDDDGNRTVIRAVDPDAQTASVRLLDSTLRTDTETYYTAEGSYEYDHTTATATQQNETWTPASVGFHASNTIQRPLRNLAIEAQTVTTVDGTPAITYTVKGIQSPNQTPPNAATGSVVVTKQGSVMAFTIRKSNDGYARRYHYRLQTESAPVTKPSWVPAN